MMKEEYLSEEELMVLIAKVEETEMVPAPFYLKESILEKAKKESKELVRLESKQSAQIQFLSFSFKVALATAAAIAVLFIAPTEIKLVSNVPERSVQEATFTEKIVGKSNELCEFLNKFTNQIISKEDYKYEKEKEK